MVWPEFVRRCDVDAPCAGGKWFGLSLSEDVMWMPLVLEVSGLA